MSTNTLKNSTEECPDCHYTFVVLDDPRSVRSCPTCHSRFMCGQSKIHKKGCNICNFRHRGANNVYYKDGCPALMSDGRFLTYYNSSNELTEDMRKMNGFKSSNQFRTFMQTNGDLFRSTERNYLIQNNTCEPETACSEGWYDLWTKKGGYWANNSGHTGSLRNSGSCQN